MTPSTACCCSLLRLVACTAANPRSRMQAFREGAVRFLIATDVAARGLDVAGLPCVINMTLPDRSEDYIHRVGRVGAPLRDQACALIVAFAKLRHVR